MGATGRVRCSCNIEDVMTSNNRASSVFKGILILMFIVVLSSRDCASPYPRHWLAALVGPAMVGHHTLLTPVRADAPVLLLR